jgi:hypothetical protein
VLSEDDRERAQNRLLCDVAPCWMLAAWGVSGGPKGGAMKRFPLNLRKT